MILINKQLMSREKIEKIAVGGSFVMALSAAGSLYAMGENYKVVYVCILKGIIGVGRSLL